MHVETENELQSAVKDYVHSIRKLFLSEWNFAELANNIIDV